MAAHAIIVANLDNAVLPVYRVSRAGRHGWGYIVVTLILAFLGLFIRCLCMAQAISQTRQPEHFSGTTAILRRIYYS
ncbi:MAG: hypothetical protein ACYSU3_14705 [Planctomycetota bacterium]